MGKFLLGLVTGIVLVILIGVIGFFAIASLRSKPPAVADGSTLVLHLWGEVPEKPPVEFAIPGVVSRNSVTVQNVWSMLRRAAQDSRIKAVIFEPEGADVGWATMQEIRADLEGFRKSGKPLYAYLKSPNLRDYYMATAASRIYLGPSDLLNVKGIGFQLMYFKNTLDKLGVQVDVEHAGAYKDYGDQFTRASMSPETKEVMNSLADGLYGDLLSVIAKGRNKDVNAVRTLIDQGPFLAKQAKANGLVDELRYEDQVFGEMKTALHQNELKRISEKEYADVSDASAGITAQDQIAFVVAEGTIQRGDDADGLQSGDFDRMLERVGSDSRVKAAIIRINSPGGEVVASDDMWRALNELKKKKPLVISMADEAASGGYYMAMTGSPIIAEPGTLTGSIGVVFGKPNLHGLYDKLGITKDTVSRGKFALIDSDYSSLNPEERAKLKEGIDATYQDFLEKVSSSRKRPVSEIEPVAQGRVWLGDQARDKGLVDSLGGIDAAIARARQLGGIPSSSRVGLVLYPGKKSLFEYITEAFGGGGGGDDAIDGLLRRVIKDPRLRIWAHPGMMRMMPFSVEFQ
jgi:protease-4